MSRTIKRKMQELTYQTKQNRHDNKVAYYPFRGMYRHQDHSSFKVYKVNSSRKRRRTNNLQLRKQGQDYVEANRQSMSQHNDNYFLQIF